MLFLLTIVIRHNNCLSIHKYVHTYICILTHSYTVNRHSLPCLSWTLTTDIMMASLSSVLWCCCWQHMINIINYFLFPSLSLAPSLSVLPCCCCCCSYCNMGVMYFSLYCYKILFYIHTRLHWTAQQHNNNRNYINTYTFALYVHMDMYECVCVYIFFNYFFSIHYLFFICNAFLTFLLRNIFL